MKVQNRLTNEIRNSKKTYLQNYFTTNFQNMIKLWSCIKSITSIENFISFCINKNKNGVESSDPSEISNLLNKSFVNIAEPVTRIEVEDAIIGFNASKSVGLYSIQVNLPKILGHHISQPLAKLINQSFITGVFPI